MKTIEKRAKEYSYTWYNVQSYDADKIVCAAEDSFIAGANSERAELTRWNDPNEVMPENSICVLIKAIDELDNEALYLGSREGDLFITDNGLILPRNFDGNTPPDMNAKVIGWREIHE